MKLINTKVPVNEVNLKTCLNLIRIICLKVTRFRFEIIETEHTYQFKFYLPKSKASPIERYWLKRRVKRFIHEEI